MWAGGIYYPCISRFYPPLRAPGVPYDDIVGMGRGVGKDPAAQSIPTQSILALVRTIPQYPQKIQPTPRKRSD